MNESMERTGNFLPRLDHTESNSAVDRRVVTLTAPASIAAEQYRTLFYSLERLREARAMKMVGFTSAMSGEGKTVTAVNLALTSASANPDRRILLMDADLRRSQIAGYLGIKSKPGLSELLQGEIELKDVVRRFKSTRLAVIPGGSVPEEPTKLLASARMKQLLKFLKDNFDEVYLDLPPTLPFADVGILAPQADGVVLVVRANVTPSKHVRQAFNHLAHVPLLGCVLNGADISATVYLKNYNMK
jgi:capsular exopolysaccharide synthesis family protein